MRLIIRYTSLEYTQYGTNVVNIIATTVKMLKEGQLVGCQCGQGCPMRTGAPSEVRMAPASTTVPAPMWDVTRDDRSGRHDGGGINDWLLPLVCNTHLCPSSLLRDGLCGAALPGTAYQIIALVV